MTKKLIKHGNSMALVIDKPILKMLGFDEKTPLELSVQDNTLVIKSRLKKSKSHEEEIDEIAKKIMKKYEPVFKKLAKS